MKDLEELKKLQEKQIAIAKQACDDSEKYSCRLKIVLYHLQDASNNILSHIEQGDTDNQKRNSELWHRLYNIEHQVSQFTKYTESSTEQFYHASEELIQFLKEIRPPKDKI